MPNLNWTLDEVKQNLPDVMVTINGHKSKCPIRGRKNKFATVFTPIGTFEVAWETVRRVLNDKSRSIKL